MTADYLVMSHPLDGAVLRIQRARTDQQQLDTEIAEARKRSRYESQTEPSGEDRTYGPDDQTRRYPYLVRARLTGEINPFWGVLAGECIYNLRCALDYLIWQLVIERTGADPPRPELVQFPIVERESDLRKGRAAVTMKQLSPPARKFIRRVQPYAHRKEKGLAWLKAISNYDKHRSALVTVRAIASGSLTFETPPNSQVQGVRARTRGPVEDGAEIGRFTLVMTGAARDSRVNVNAKFAYQEVFQTPALVRGKPVLRTLDVIRRVVERILREANPLFAARPYDTDADDYRREVRFPVKMRAVPAVTLTGGCPHWTLRNVTRDGFELVHRGDPHHPNYQEPEWTADAEL
jgi:hypothetical protein